MWGPGRPGVLQDMDTTQGLGAQTGERQCLFLRAMGPSALDFPAHSHNGDQGSF